MADTLLSGMHVFVTGGASGIGEGIVRDVLNKGGSVSFVDINQEAGEALAAELKSSHGADAGVFFTTCDVTKFDQVESAVSAAAEALGPILGLVNNAGRNSYADPVEMTEKEWDDFFNLDLKASWLTAKAILPMMREAGRGSIVQIASIHARMSHPDYFPYAAAKSGLIGLTRNLALDEGKYGIRVNAVSPGYTDTPLLRGWFESAPEAEQRALELHPLGYIGTPQDVAHVVSFLLSDHARFVSGADWAVDGALSSRFAS